MRSKEIYDFLEYATLALRIRGIDRSAIARPNVFAEVLDKPLYFELSVSDYETRSDTERSVTTRCRGSITAVSELGTGLERTDAIIQGLVDIFSSYNARALTGWRARERVYPYPNREKSALVYVVGTERSDGAIVDGRYKQTVSVILEIYEE